MKLYFYRTSIYTTFSEALSDNAVAQYHLDDVPNPSIRSGTAAAVVEAALLTADLLGGDSEPLLFVLTTDDDRVLDQLESADLFRVAKVLAQFKDYL